MFRLFSFIVLCSLWTNVFAYLNATEIDAFYILRNERLYTVVEKARGQMVSVYLDGVNLLKDEPFAEPVPGSKSSGTTGIGPYLDCSCIPSGFWTPGSSPLRYFKFINGTDSTGKKWGGIIMGDKYAPTGQVLEQYIFLREGEIGLHMFSRVTYYNETTPFLRGLGELRTLFRPTTPLWTHYSTNDQVYAPAPNLTGAVTVQDATWYIPDREDPYVQQFSDYFTKYTFHAIWRDHDVHGMYADGSKSSDGSTYGAWLVMNTKDTYFGGPLHGDLVVDGIVYNYIVGGHFGALVPNITNGFDRTFGPAYYHFNKGPASATMKDLRADAAQYANPEWNAAFYDSIAKHVPNYVPTSGRGQFTAKVVLPKGAKNPIAVLAKTGVDFQDNAFDPKALQYWGEIGSDGQVAINRVKADTYRLTIYAEGIFGDYKQDNVVIKAGRRTSVSVTWKEESAGAELWRIGTPDKSSGEYRHGYAKDPTHILHPPEHRIYWGVYDFPTDFPDGINFDVGKSDVSEDLNYIHWSIFGGRGNSVRPVPYLDVNNWTITFDVDERKLRNTKIATFTIQLAGAKTAAGNTKAFNAPEPYSNVPYTINVNGKDLQPWIIP